MSTGYLIDHPKSNMKLSPQHPHWSRHYERLGLGSQKKEIRHWHLAFWDHVESPLDGFFVKISDLNFLLENIMDFENNFQI